MIQISYNLLKVNMIYSKLINKNNRKILPSSILPVSHVSLPEIIPSPHLAPFKNVQVKITKLY